MGRGSALKDQTAASISAALIKICCTFGIPEVLHSDQGRNFESQLFRDVLQPLKFRKVVQQLTTFRVMVYGGVV